MSKTAFIGHRNVNFASKVEKRLEAAIEEQIAKGCSSFIMGTHGDFDSMALSACRKARAIHANLEINVVITSYHKIKKKDDSGYVPYQDVNTVMYETELEHFKRRILVSNRKMMDECDTLICYVDKARKTNGAKMAMKYAKRKGMTIINIYREDDDPVFGMNEEELKKYWTSVPGKEDN